MKKIRSTRNEISELRKSRAKEKCLELMLFLALLHFTIQKQLKSTAQFGKATLKGDQIKYRGNDSEFMFEVDL